VVITSSFAAILDAAKGAWPGHKYTEADWNPITYEEASKPETDGSTAYCASKTFAERAAWDFVKDKKPNFTVSTICPPMVYGPAAHAPSSVRELNTSTADIYRLCNGSTTEVPDTSFFAFVDSRDVGEAHLKAYEAAEPNRYFVTGGNYTYQQVCDIIRKDFPARRDLTPEGTPGAPIGDVYKVDNSRAEKELGITFRDLQTTIHDMVAGFDEIEKRGGL
jgi:nucleoside-diphosphate-sugar epimerase